MPAFVIRFERSGKGGNDYPRLRACIDRDAGCNALEGISHGSLAGKRSGEPPRLKKGGYVGGYPRSCFGQRFYLAHHAIKIQTYRNAEFKREFGRACTGGRAQDWVPQASGPFLGADQGRDRDQQRHGTKAMAGLPKTPVATPSPSA